MLANIPSKPMPVEEFQVNLETICGAFQLEASDKQQPLRVPYC